jgi:hypothetical protein
MARAMWPVKQQADGDEGHRDEAAAPKALKGAADKDHLHRRGHGADRAAEAEGQGRSTHRQSQPEAQGDQRTGCSKDDRADLVERHRPADIGRAADIGDDPRQHRCHHQTVSRVQPDRHADQ